MRTRPAQAILALALLALPVLSPAAILVVDDDGGDCPSAPYRTIAAALGAAGRGDEIRLCEGTYAEQLVITRPVRLTGQGTGSGAAVIRPRALIDTRSSLTGGRPVAAAIHADAEVLIADLVLDLQDNEVAACTPLLAGVYFRNTGGSILRSRIVNVRVPGHPDCESGVAVLVETSSNGKAKVNLVDNVLEGFQKSGLVANGAGANVKMSGGEVVGDGARGGAVQNGIQLGLGAKGRLNQIGLRDLVSTVPGKSAAGVLLWKPGRGSVKRVLVDASQTGMFVVGRAKLQGNTITGSVGDAIVLLGDSSLASANVLDGAGVSGVFVDGNRNRILFGTIANMPVGLWFYDGDRNSFNGIRFDNVGLQMQGVFGGPRDMSEATAAPLAGACRTATDCDDGNACTADSCDTNTGACAHASVCDDADVCTDDSCGPLGCLHDFNTASCNDGNACTVADTCRDGACLRGAPAVCEDGNTCTFDACSPTLGCVHLSACDDRNPCTQDTCDATGCHRVTLPNGTPCPDQNPCNGSESCLGGVCAPALPPSCDDGNACTADTCDFVNGCRNAPLTNNTSCADTDVCNGAETCQAGTCQPGTTLPCDDGNACTTDSCNPLSGCAHAPIAGCVTCTVVADCNDSNPCTTDACNAGACQNTNVTNGTPCLDGNLCNGTETCQAGACTAGTALDCDDGNACTVDGCDATAGCQHPAALDGTPCPDTTVCNGAETCQAGTCTAGAPLACDDGNPCTTDSCLPISGCQHPAVPNGTGCSDGDACNGAETCQAGSCTAGAPLACDDGNDCTLDSCDPVGGCQHPAVANGTPCPDGTVCNGAETCQGGACSAGPPLACGDGDACTTDACNALSGCSNTPIPGCTPCAVPADCDDGNPCSADACNAGACANTALADGTPCLDLDLCNGAESCLAGVCIAGTPLGCDDGNLCTADSCMPTLGCEHTGLPDGAPCPNFTLCDGDETCQGSVCAPGPAPDCADTNPCTADTCNAVSGCEHLAVSDGTSCADGTVCNGGELCQSGLCMPGLPLACDDGNECTADSCDAVNGCTHTPEPDGTACTGGTCTGGTCQ
jgi:hypothetical protein